VLGRQLRLLGSTESGVPPSERAAEIVVKHFGSDLQKQAGLLFLIVLLAFYGRKWVTRILAFKAVFLSIVFLAYFVVILCSNGERIVAEFAHFEVGQRWIGGALRYTLYASVLIPAMLFATSEIKTRREALVSGVLSATGGMIPGALLHLSFGAAYPAVLHQTIPAYWMIASLGVPLLTGSYIVVLFGCLMDTGLCFVQSVNERVDGWLAEQARRQITRPARAGIAILCVLVSGALSSVGVVDLIAKGYGTMAWGFLARISHRRSDFPVRGRGAD
jgi:uncharacterized membrane protein YkvI